LNAWFSRTLGAAAALLCPSCLECREEFWLQADGSGRAEIRASIPASVLAMKGGEQKLGQLLGGFLRDSPELRGSTYRIREDGDRAAIDLDLTFGSALDLADSLNSPSAQALPDAAKHLAGEIQTRIRGRTLELERCVSPGKALPGAAFLPASTFEGRRMISIVHLPAPAFDHNATRVENGGRTLVWDVPVAEAMRKPLVSRFKMKSPVPWPLVGGVGAAICLIAAWAGLRWKKKSASRWPRQD
jgi:hypothetical protein